MRVTKRQVCFPKLFFHHRDFECASVQSVGYEDAIGMSALPPKADMCGATRDVRFGPMAGRVSMKTHDVIIGFHRGPPLMHRDPPQTPLGRSRRSKLLHSRPLPSSFVL